ncbi:unnamed protein product [Rotaria sp. Silwood1]|nr:unnamed protein product [Rotaria sp. Silwood1]
MRNGLEKCKCILCTLLKRQETIIRRRYDREIYWKRLQLDRIYDTLNASPIGPTDNFRIQTPMSFHTVRTQRNQSAPPNKKKHRKTILNNQ